MTQVPIPVSLVRSRSTRSSSSRVTAIGHQSTPSARTPSASAGGSVSGPRTSMSTRRAARSMVAVTWE